MPSPVVALILAGGMGSRSGRDLPKQFVKIAGRSVLQQTLSAFDGLCDAILVVCAPEWAQEATPYLTAPAGATGYDSLCSGISALSKTYPDETLVMIHDAVRPLVTRDVITANLQVARKYGVAVTAIETYETLLYAPSIESLPTSMQRREGVYRVQTPQTFTLGMLRQLICEATRQNISTPQCACDLAYRLGVTLHMSPGAMQNFKITTPSDFALYEALLP